MQWNYSLSINTLHISFFFPVLWFWRTQKSHHLQVMQSLVLWWSDTLMRSGGEELSCFTVTVAAQSGKNRKWNGSREHGRCFIGVQNNHFQDTKLTEEKLFFAAVSGLMKGSTDTCTWVFSSHVTYTSIPLHCFEANVLFTVIHLSDSQS